MQRPGVRPSRGNQPSVYSLTERAQADLEAIYARGVDLFGIPQADDYAAGLMKTVNFLSDFPRAARERVETRRHLRAYPFKSHLIVYLMDGEDILIVRVRHAHEDWLPDPL